MEPTLLEQIIEQSVAYAQTIGLRLFINDYWFLAQKYQAYGVHLGQEDLDAMDYSQLLKLSHSGIRLGISTHSESELAKALGLGPSYVALGPIFSTTCKSMAFGPHGLAKISQWRQMTDLPIVAIGGMKPGHIKEAFQRGASGIAVISDVLEHPDPEKRCREWSRQVDSNRRFLF
jgi:thiamine-phosphate diphosphorylase